MSSIQERLQMKRVPLDTWSSKEQLCLASSVVRSGDQNWMSVSRALKSLGDPSRPADWFSQKSCAAQYGTLLEHVETPKRKKRTADGAAETPQESIVKKLTQERIAEIQKVMGDLSQQYQILKEEINEVRSPTTSAARLREMCATMETERRQRDREQARQQQWLREREERKARVEKAWRPVTGAPVPSTSTSPASSPLLTSLLKSTGTGSTAQITQPPLTQVLHIPHPSTVVDTVSPSAGAPTLSMLLEKPSGTHTQQAVITPMPSIPDTNKNAVIEQIKNQLQEIEHQLKGGTMNTPQPTLVAAPVVTQEEPPPSSIEEPVKTPDKIDIDDIEIKAEDVYAFSDIDLEIPPVSTIHKTPLSRTLDKTLFNKKDNNGALGTSLDDLPEPHDFSNMSSGRQSCEEESTEVQPKIEPVPEGEPREAKDNAKTEAGEDYKQDAVETVAPERIEAATPARNDTTKASTSDTDIEIKKEPADLMPTIALADIPPPKDKDMPVVHEHIDLNEDSNPPEVSGESKADEESDSADAQPELEELVHEKEVRVPTAGGDSFKADSFKADNKSEITEEDKDEENDSVKSEVSDQKKEEPSTEPATEPPETEERLDEVISIGKEDKEDSKEITSEEPATESQTETDDDTPMEVIREEDKLGRTKRDYSRRRLEPAECGESGPRADFSDEAGSDNSSHALTEKKIGRPKISTSRSESPATPMDSLPGSPATPTTLALPAPPPAVPAAPPHDPDRDHRLWKKSVMLVYSRLCAHKYASLFLRPITDDQAPGYSLVVKRPMDLTTIKKNIDAGIIRSTAEFQREVLLMLVNALMYNSSWHRVHAMARDMMREASAQLGMLLQAQAHAALEPSTRRAPVKRKRNTHTPPSVHHKKRRTHE